MTEQWFLEVVQPSHNHCATGPATHLSLRKLFITREVKEVIKSRTASYSIPAEIITELYI